MKKCYVNKNTDLKLQDRSLLFSFKFTLLLLEYLHFKIETDVLNNFKVVGYKVYIS